MKPKPSQPNLFHPQLTSISSSSYLNDLCDGVSGHIAGVLLVFSSSISSKRFVALLYISIYLRVLIANERRTTIHGLENNIY